MKEIFTQTRRLFFLMFLMGFTSLNLIAQTSIQVAPLSCYPQFASASAMDGAAAASSATTPFATWKGAYDYAIANGVMTIDFVAGTYSTSLSGFRADWGDADGGFVLPAGMTVNGNGAVIDNSPVGSSQICFATLGSNCTVNGFVFSQLSGTPNGGALFVPSSADNWTINDCDFYNCNQGTDALTVNMGATTVGYITGCDFYGNSNPNAEYPASPGLPSSSALDIQGSLTSDLNITNSTFSCNFRNVSGGAVKIQDDVHVDFDGCTFYRNEANSSRGGAVDIGTNAEVLFNNTSFIENFTTGSGAPFGGALALQDGSTVTITGCNFRLNTAVEDGGAIYMSGGAASTTTVTISGTIFEENFNAGGYDGGALYVQNYTVVEISNCLFLNNTSGDKGAAIWVDGTSTKDLDILSSTFVNNNAGSGEATIHVNYLDTDTDVYIDNSVICDNNSSEDVESEYFTALTTINNCYWDNDKGTINFTGTNTNPYTPSYDANWNEASGAGWTGTYTQVSGSGTCPSPPAPAADCEDQGSISGVAFEDVNENGIDDDGAPIAGVMVELFNCDGTSTGISMTTGASGEYYFGGLDNGSCYYLVFSDPVGLIPTTPNAGGSTSTNDSDVDPGTNQSPQITINTTGNIIDEDDDTTGETHYVTVDAGFSESGPLPVELISFTGQTVNCLTELRWETASEINNYFFEVERSEDGRVFKAVALLYGAGTTETKQSYQYTDEPLVAKRTTYYRLKQVDYDGSYAYSDIVSVKGESCKAEVKISSAYPNPFNGNLTFEINNSLNSTDGVLEIYNVIGHKVLSYDIEVFAGQTTFVTKTEGLAPGTYFARLLGSGYEITTAKLIKTD